MLIQYRLIVKKGSPSLKLNERAKQTRHVQLAPNYQGLDGFEYILIKAGNIGGKGANFRQAPADWDLFLTSCWEEGSTASSRGLKAQVSVAARGKPNQGGRE